jgi:AcrR family transcriptional regulator
MKRIAARVGFSEPAIYRHFPNKQALLAALVARETHRLRDAMLAAAAETSSLAGAATAVITTGARVLGAHPALTFVAAHEPELLMPYLAFEAEDAVLRTAAALVAPAFTPYLDADHAERFGEWIARIAMSYLCCPSDRVDVCDPVQVRTLVDEFVVPGFVRPVASEGVVQ